MRCSLAMAGFAVSLSSITAEQNISGPYQVVYAVWQRGSANHRYGLRRFEGIGKYTFQGTHIWIAVQASSGRTAADLTGSWSGVMNFYTPSQVLTFELSNMLGIPKKGTGFPAPLMNSSTTVRT